MSTSINLDGKKQIVNHEDENETALIIEAMIKRLMVMDFPDLRKNIIVALTNVAELPDGF
jgi:hypothetical protein